MSAPLSLAGRQVWAAVRALLIATVVLGIVYPLVITGIAQVIAPGRADGSLVGVDGEVVGSSLIGQGFTDPTGDPLPQYFQARPSASDYDGAASGGSNLGPNSEELTRLIERRRAEVASFNGVPPRTCHRMRSPRPGPAWTPASPGVRRYAGRPRGPRARGPGRGRRAPGRARPRSGATSASLAPRTSTSSN